MDDKMKNYSKRKIDSILIGEDKYFTERDFLTTNFLREVEKGTISLYEVNNNLLGIKRKGYDLYPIPESKYRYAYNLFCKNTFGKDSSEMNKDEFIEKVEAYNSSTSISSEKPVLFDSIRKSSEAFLTRLSFLRPEVGFEAKITNGISIYNSFGMNFFGDMFRDAQTIINYDYSGAIRFYYNQRKRLKQGKSNYNFSGPYYAVTYKHIIDVNQKNKHVIRLIHGWQFNNLFKSLYSGFRFGLGFNPKNDNIIVMSFLNMGFAF